MPSLMFSLLFGVCWCVLIHMTAGAPSLKDWRPSVEGHVLPPMESSNHTTGTGSHAVKRFADYPRACQEIYSRLDPQIYFGTTDVFIPRFIYTIECAGTANNAPTCGPPNGHMHCLTRRGLIEFVRMPRRPSQCRRQRRVVISNVPVGCYCV